MRRSSKPLPKDPNQLAHEIVRISTEEPETTAPSSAVSEYLARIGRKGGLKGGNVRAEKLTHRRKVEIAKNAAKVRWSKKSV